MFEAYVVASDTSKDMSQFRHFCDRFWSAGMAASGSRTAGAGFLRVVFLRFAIGVRRHLWTSTDTALLPNAEAAENFAEQVLAGEFAGDLPEGMLREPQILGE
jgi:hypothetical protein